MLNSYRGTKAKFHGIPRIADISYHDTKTYIPGYSKEGKDIPEHYHHQTRIRFPGNSAIPEDSYRGTKVNPLQFLRKEHPISERKQDSQGFQFLEDPYRGTKEAHTTAMAPAKAVLVPSTCGGHSVHASVPFHIE